ncbi:transcription factor of the MADS box [Coemansia spiralis]|nr:transcription factor of the MADS box [Coemansia spiralis]
MNSAFVAEDPSRLGSAAGLLLDQQTPHPDQQSRFSSASDSRAQTLATKRTREDDESDAGESESNSRAANETIVVEKPRTGRRKIKIEYIEDKSRRHITFSKRKAGIMKKAYELSTLTGTQVLLLVVSETGLVYTFTTPKLQPIVTQSDGKNLIQACLSVPDQPGDRIPQPIPTESNAYISQPRSHHHHAAAAAAAAAAVSALGVAGTHDAMHPSASLIDDHKQHDSGSPVTVGHAQSYLQYPYGQSAMAQAVAAASSSSAVGAYAHGMVPHSAAAAAAAAAANGGMQYTTVPSYASYPGSSAQSQHHSPTTGAATHPSQHSSGISAAAAAAAAAAASMPGITSLASYHHGYTTPHQGHYSYHQAPPSHHGQHQLHPAHGQMHGSAPGTPSGSGTSVSAALAAVAAVAGSQHPPHGIPPAPGGMATAPYMTGHYWAPTTLASPHQHPLPPPLSQHQQPSAQQQAASLAQRAGYAGSG